MSRSSRCAKAGDARQAEPEVYEGVLEIFAALRAAMHGKAGWLVHHQHQPVTVEHARENLFRRHAGQAIERARNFFAVRVMGAYRKILQK